MTQLLLERSELGGLELVNPGAGVELPWTIQMAEEEGGDLEDDELFDDEDEDEEFEDDDFLDDEDEEEEEEDEEFLEDEEEEEEEDDEV